MKEQGYFSRHWHGELSLPAAFWVNNGLLSVPAGIAIGVLAAWIAARGDYLRGGSIAILVAWPLLMAFSVWCIVGAWRSASAYLADDGSRLWGYGAKLLLAVGAVHAMASAAFDFAPNVGSWLRMARGIDPIGHVDATISPDGRKLQLRGSVGMGDGERVRRLLAGATGVRTVELDSPGGRLKEADLIAAHVRQAGWTTRAIGPCESACTLIYLAGNRRQVMPGAKLGFHRASTGMANPALDALANRMLAQTYREAGLSDHFVMRTLATPASRMWHPARDELVAGGLITVPERPLDVELPTSPDAQANEYADALRANDTWLAVEKRFPGSVTAAAGRMAQARAAGAAPEVIQVEGQRIVESHLPALLARASAETRDLYLSLFAAQLAAARGIDATTCAGVLALHAQARRSLPPALAQRESAWLIDAAAEIPREGPPRGANSLETEVVRRRLGDRAPALLADFWRPGVTERTARECDKALELISAVGALPLAERKLATRLVFERP
jgi:hypothetical protein